MLMALNKTDTDVEMLSSGSFIELCSCDWENTPFTWILGSPLFHQQPDTIEFLFNTLGCE